MFEVIQLLTGIGDFDVDDILLNVIGSICGYIFYLCLNADINH
jgi:glycopeptide antibiotics resistance protein